MREFIHHKIRAPENAKAIEMARRAGYKVGGKVAAAEDVHKHEDHLHKGAPKTKLKAGGRIKRRAGGHVGGKEPPKRLDKKARGGGTEEYKGVRVDERAIKQPEHDVDSEAAPQKRARGGKIGKRGPHKTNIIIHAGGGENPQAAQQAHQQGVQEGAMKVMGALKAKMAGAGGAPPMGGPPPGGMPGGPPPMAAPPMGGGMPPMGRKRGGKVEHVTVKEHTRRKAGGAVKC